MPGEMSAPTAFRAMLAAGQVVMPGAFNAISAKLVQASGFQAVYVSGAGVTNSLTGFPDVALLTLTEMAKQARYIVNAVTVPCIADADTGYGETLNVARAVQELEATGLAGIHLEDQVSPKRCGHLDGKQILPIAEMQMKIAAATRARRNGDFLLIARTDARGVESFDSAAQRALAYLDAGADAIFPEALQSRDEFAEFARRVPAPLLANMTEFGKSPLLTTSDLDDLGYRMVIFPMTQFRIMMKAAESGLRQIKLDGTQAALLESMQTRAELYELIDYPAYTRFDSEISALFPKQEPSTNPPSEADQIL